MSIDNLSDMIVDDSSGCPTEIRLERVVILQRRGRQGLDVDRHLVHVGEPRLDGCKFAEDFLRSLSADLPGRLVRKFKKKVGLHLKRLRDGLFGRRHIDMAMKIDRQAFARPAGRDDPPPPTVNADDPELHE